MHGNIRQLQYLNTDFEFREINHFKFTPNYNAQGGLQIRQNYFRLKSVIHEFDILQ